MTLVVWEWPPPIPVIVIVLGVEWPPFPVRVSFAVDGVGFGENDGPESRRGSGPVLSVTSREKPLPRTIVIV